MAARNKAIREAQAAYAASQAAYDAEAARVRAAQAATVEQTGSANRVGRGTADEFSQIGSGVRRSAPRLGSMSRLVGFSR